MVSLRIADGEITHNLFSQSVTNLGHMAPGHATLSNLPPDTQTSDTVLIAIPETLARHPVHSSLFLLFVYKTDKFTEALLGNES